MDIDKMANSNIVNNLFPIDETILSSIDIKSSGLSNIQLAWISGYYWGKANGGSDKNFILNSNISEEVDTITIVSSSQTGNAHNLATIVFSELKSNGYNVRLVQICDYSIKKLLKEKYFLLITSTQGEGEPPEEAIPFYNFLMSSKVNRLDHLYFSVFGLGDSSYSFFCKIGKDFDVRLNELGATRLLDRIDADVEYIELGKQWCLDLISFFKNKIKKSISNNILSVDSFKKKSVSIIDEKISRDNPYSATLLVNQKITGRYSMKDIRHIEIGVCDSKIYYLPGDALGIWYENSRELVLDILNLFKINSDEHVTVNNESVSIFNALTRNYELTVNTSNLVKNYSKISNSNFLKNIASDSNKMFLYAKNTPIFHMFSLFPAVLTALQLVSLLRPLTPRLYSISSSQLVCSDEVHITVGVLQYIVANRVYQGGASSYLSYRVPEESKINIFVQSNNHFRLPKDNNASIIMIGPGTGIAPFRAFMQERQSVSAKGKNWIFYGNCTFSEDFLYQREWQNYFYTGFLTKIDLAWSRDLEEKVYVQHKLWSKGKEVWNWIDNGAYVYVCGDKKNMAKDVESTLLKIFLKYGSMNIEQAHEYLNILRTNHRYQRDVY